VIVFTERRPVSVTGSAVIASSQFVSTRYAYLCESSQGVFMKGYIIEGVVGAGKSTLLQAIEHELIEQYEGSSRLVLTEHYTDRLFEDARRKGEATFAEGLEHCEEIARRVVWLADIQYTSKFADVRGRASMHVLVERFVGTQVAHHVRHRELTPAEANRAESLLRSLAEVGIESIVFEVDLEVLAETIHATRKHRIESWSHYLESIGDEKEVVEYFTAWQKRLLKFYAEHDVDHHRIVIDSVEAAREVGARASALVDRWQ